MLHLLVAFGRSSPCLKHPTKSPLSNVTDIFNVVAWIFETQELGVEEERQSLVHGVGVKSVQQEL